MIKDINTKATINIERAQAKIQMEKEANQNAE